MGCDRLTETLGRELTSENISVNADNAKVSLTEMHEEYRPVPIGRIGMADEIASTVALSTRCLA